MMWPVGPTVPTCQLTGRWHGMPTVHADVIIMSCWHHPYPGRSRGSGQLVFGSSQPIRAKKTHGARWRAWTTTLSARAALSNVRFRRRFHQYDRLFLLYTVVLSKHHFDNFYFWEKIKHHFKPYALILIVGDSDRWCFDSCPLEA